VFRIPAGGNTSELTPARATGRRTGSVRSRRTDLHHAGEASPRRLQPPDPDVRRALTLLGTTSPGPAGILAGVPDLDTALSEASSAELLLVAAPAPDPGLATELEAFARREIAAGAWASAAWALVECSAIGQVLLAYSPPAVDKDFGNGIEPGVRGQRSGGYRPEGGRTEQPPANPVPQIEA
jgi:hypothetical protein